MVNPIQLHSYHKGPGELISWVYLHGDVEDKYGFDLVRCKEGFPQEPGIYDALVEDTECHLYLWQPEKLPHIKGLVVAKNDPEAIAYAQRCYAEKSITV